jgi:hypothetical protein
MNLRIFCIWLVDSVENIYLLFGLNAVITISLVHTQDIRYSDAGPEIICSH